ncbi:hypothetical protein [Chengkuizengella axinellae]|uniref:Helix-turn-helix domain-containing protein n=1 Tax=Chengkuizengella axinellae TaxID=3064388 RepID=A0ABT9J3E3_9BACL|nr:hypothetical protein [Chengkuizengella sp. 2205SS18-9]MDP5276142.1 hypothetical protein [Chengkuizengella sp. 2205SS18-9]
MSELFNIVVDAEATKKQFSSRKRELEKIRKLAKDTEDVELLDETEMDLKAHNRFINNLSAQIELVNLSHRVQIIPEEFISAAKLTELQQRVIHKRSREQKKYKQIELEIAIEFNQGDHRMNARDCFAKAFKKIMKVAKGYQEAISLGLLEEDALIYATMTKNTRIIWLKYIRGRKVSDIAIDLDKSTAYISKVLRPYKKR